MADIAYVDDDPSAFMSLLRNHEKGLIQEFEYGPEFSAVEAFAAAKAANVWLFDFFLVTHQEPSTNDENGLSFFQKWKKAASSAQPTTVLLSNQLEQAINEPLGKIERRHVLAQRHGVEWLGEKNEETLRQVIALAEAATIVGRRLKTTPSKDPSFGTYDLEQLCFDVLGVSPRVDWRNSAQRQVDRARPPRKVPIGTEAATARSIIGWLLAHVLPYPSFLLTDAQAALRLQISPESFRAVAHAIELDRHKSEYRSLFAESQYAGPLAAFLGRRWWRAAIDDLTWQLSQAESGYEATLLMLAEDVQIEVLSHSEPVLVSDADLVEMDEVAEAAECVRATDEDFPANIDPAWVRIKEAWDDKKLAAKVIFEDRDLLSQGE